LPSHALSHAGNALKDNHAVANHNHSDGEFSATHEVSFISSRYPASTFGEYIKKARLEKGLRQKDVARAIGLNEMTIANWERRASPPTRLRYKVEWLCKLLEVGAAV